MQVSASTSADPQQENDFFEWMRKDLVAIIVIGGLVSLVLLLTVAVSTAMVVKCRAKKIRETDVHRERTCRLTTLFPSPLASHPVLSRHHQNRNLRAPSKHVMNACHALSHGKGDQLAHACVAVYDQWSCQSALSSSLSLLSFSSQCTKHNHGWTKC